MRGWRQTSHLQSLPVFICIITQTVNWINCLLNIHFWILGNCNKKTVWCKPFYCSSSYVWGGCPAKKITFALVSSLLQLPIKSDQLLCPWWRKESSEDDAFPTLFCMKQGFLQKTCKVFHQQPSVLTGNVNDELQPVHISAGIQRQSGRFNLQGTRRDQDFPFVTVEFVISATDSVCFGGSDFMRPVFPIIVNTGWPSNICSLCNYVLKSAWLECSRGGAGIWYSTVWGIVSCQNNYVLHDHETSVTVVSATGWGSQRTERQLVWLVHSPALHSVQHIVYKSVCVKYAAERSKDACSLWLLVFKMSC